MTLPLEIVVVLPFVPLQELSAVEQILMEGEPLCWLVGDLQTEMLVLVEM